MSAPACLSCGAPWKGNISGACSFCQQDGAPPGSELPPGFGLDPEAFCMALLARGQDADPLGALAGPLQAALGPGAVAVEPGPAGAQALWVKFNDFTFGFTGGPAGPIQVSAVHEVRGIVIKSETLDFTNGVAEFAIQLATWAGRDPGARSALVNTFS